MTVAPVLSGILLLLASAVSHRADAATDISKIERFAVKTSSSLPGIASSELRGSGVLFSYGKKIYVVTSEHVVYHTNGKTLHSAWNPAIGKRTAKLLWADWGTGLALLELSDSADLAGTTPGLTLFAGRDSSAGSPVTLAGFPLRSRGLVADPAGRVLIARSERHLVPLLPYMSEVIGGHGEYGMSGGPAVAPESGAVIGLLSHQSLEIASGRTARVTEFTPARPRARNHILLIPSSYVLERLAAYFEAPEAFTVAFTRVAERQTEFQRIVVESGGLTFEARAPKSAGVGGGDGAGIGGGDGAGIGGGDGAGIGGASASAPGSVLQVGWNSSSASPIRSVWPFRSKTAFYQDLRRALLARKHVQITGFARVSDDGKSLQSVPFRRIEAFFSQLSRSQDFPITRVNGNSKDARTPGKVALLGGKLLQSVDALGQRAAWSANRDAASLIETLRLISSWARSVDPGTLPPSLIETVENDHPGWDPLFIEKFHETVDALRVLREIRTELSRRAL